MGKMQLKLRKFFKAKSNINLFTGIGYQILNTVLGLVLPYLFIMTFGSETNGLLSSIAQFFVYLGLLEAGVATTSLQALYIPISQKNHVAVNGIISATSEYHKKTGVVYFCLLVILSLIYPCLVNTGLPFGTVVIVIILEGLSSVWNFLFQLKYEVLIKADGKIYVKNIIMILFAILTKAGKIIAISLGCGIIIVQIVNIFATILISGIYKLYVNKTYPWLNVKATPNYGAINQHKSVILQSVAFLVFNNTDVLMLTFVLQDLKLVSVYSVYNLIFNAIQNLIDAFANSFQYKLGKAMADKVELNRFFFKYKKLYYIFSLALILCAYLLIKPFLMLYVGKANDINYMIMYLPELFFCMESLKMFRDLDRQLINAAGHFKKTERIVIAEMIINISTSLLLIFKLGICGVIIGTIIALSYSIIAYSKYCSKNILGICMFQDSIFTCSVVVLTVVLAIVGTWIVQVVDSYVLLFAEALLVMLIIGICYICLLKISRCIDGRKTRNNNCTSV